jgi:energy-coupling factor transporter transmembrane protein EcfT
MECRSYHGGEGRTRLNKLRMAGADWAVLALFVALQAAVTVLTVWFGL